MACRWARLPRAGPAARPHHRARPGPRPSQPPASQPPAASQATGPGDIPVIGTAREGQPFEVALQYASTGSQTQWRITLDIITCGGSGIFDPKILAAGGQPAPPPPAGQEYCLVKFSVTNKSTSSQPWGADYATVNVGQDAYKVEPGSTGGLIEQDYWNDAQPQSLDSDFGINPGISGVSWAVFQLPARAHVTSVSVPAGSVGIGTQALQVVIPVGATS